MWWHGLTTLLVTLGALNWSHGNSIMVRRSQTNQEPSLTFPSNDRLQDCGVRMLETLKYHCKNRGPSHTSSHQLADKRSLSRARRARIEQPHFIAQGKREEEYEGNLEDVIIGRNKRLADTDTLRRNLVEECCQQPCHYTQLYKYCPVISSISTFVEATTTTTTTPPPFRSHRLVRNRNSGTGGGPNDGGNKGGDKINTNQEIRQEIIRDAIQCLFNPKCVRQFDGYLSDAPENSYSGSRLHVKPLKKKTSTSSPDTSNKQIFCSAKRERKKGRRKQEDISRVLPFLLQLISWTVAQTERSQPQASARQGQDGAYFSDVVVGGGGGGSGGGFIRNSNTNGTSSRNINGDYSQFGYVDEQLVLGSGDHNRQQQQSQHSPFGVEHGQIESQITETTDAPPIDSYVGFSLGTNDGIHYNH